MHLSAEACPEGAAKVILCGIEGRWDAPLVRNGRTLAIAYRLRDPVITAQRQRKGVGGGARPDYSKLGDLQCSVCFLSP